jgi:hypothetical protein
MFAVQEKTENERLPRPKRTLETSVPVNPAIATAQAPARAPEKDFLIWWILDFASTFTFSAGKLHCCLLNNRGVNRGARYKW